MYSNTKITKTQILRIKMFNKSLGSGTPSGMADMGVAASADSAQDNKGKNIQTNKHTSLRYRNRLTYSFIFVRRFSVIFQRKVLHFGDKLLVTFDDPNKHHTKENEEYQEGDDRIDLNMTDG